MSWWRVKWWVRLGPPRARRILLALIVVGTLLRGAWVAYAAVPPQFVSDPSAYLLQGKQIADGHGYTNPLVAIGNTTRAARHLPLIAEQASSFYPPGYPAFIAAVAWVVWHSPIPDGDGAVVRTVGFVQAVFGALSILLLYELARRVAGTRVALVAAALMALYPGLITLTATLQLETVFITLSLAALLVVLPLATADEPARGRLLLGGAMIGAVALVRPTIALLIVAFAVTRLVARRPWRETVAGVLLIAAAMVAVIVPWTVRNALALHAFVPLSTGIGPALCMARNVEATGHIDSRVLVARCAPPAAHRSPAQEDVAANTFATREAIRWVVHHPLGEVGMWWHRTYYAYRSDSTGIDDFGSSMRPGLRHLVTTLSNAVSFVVLALAAAGGVMIALARRRPCIFVLASTVCFAAVPLILFGDPRYRVPAEPLFMLLASVALCAGYASIRPSVQSSG